MLHCTTMRGPLRARPPVVVTVHDLRPAPPPRGVPALAPAHGPRRRFATAPRHADAVVAVSAFTRDELVELLDVPASGSASSRTASSRSSRPTGRRAPGDYVLAVGTLEPRKNLARAVEAARLAGVELRVVGAPGWGGVEVPGWAGRVDDDELAALYRGARCLVFPSLYEGFGLPVLEAMACGTPVVTSRGGATEEVAGGAAVLVDPLDAGVDRGRDRRGRAAARRARRARARAGAARSRWARAADLVEALWRELA